MVKQLTRSDEYQRLIINYRKLQDNKITPLEFKLVTGMTKKEAYSYIYGN
jgi:hypothetical protein